MCLMRSARGRFKALCDIGAVADEGLFPPLSLEIVLGRF